MSLDNADAIIEGLRLVHDESRKSRGPPQQVRATRWVLRPDHFHLLLKPEPAESTSLILKRLKEETATHILKVLREQQQYPWCRKMLARLRLPPTVHDESHYRLWQRRFYPFNVYSEKKRLEKLDSRHNNPVPRGLVSSPGDWAWSSWRF